MSKIYTSADQLIGRIRRYGVDIAGDTIKGVAREMAAEQFSALAYQKIPAFEMPNGEVLYVEYNKESDTLDVGQPTNAGLVAQHRFPYDHNIGLDANLQAVNEKLNASVLTNSSFTPSASARDRAMSAS